jgi:hypothetical protein
VRPVEYLIKSLFAIPRIAKEIVRGPQPVEIATEIFESKYFEETLPYLDTTIDGKRYCKG